VTCKLFFLHGTRLLRRKETEPHRITGKGAGEGILVKECMGRHKHKLNKVVTK